MTFESPWRLLLLLAVAALLGVYLLAQRRRSRYAVRFTSLHLLDKVAPDRPSWRKHVAAGLFLGMIGLLVAGFARPSADVRVARDQATVVVAIDVSNSMEAADVEPDRLGAARTQAAEFVRSLPDQFKVGLVAFAGEASALVVPVDDRDAVISRIEGLNPQSVGRQGTAIGEAIAASMEAVSAVPTETEDGGQSDEAPPARIVVLSDGANTAGQDPGLAADAAAAAGLPVDTISFGTPDGVMINGDRQQPVPVNGETLQDVAERTDGNYYEAASSQDLDEAYSDVGSAVGFETERQDISARFIGVALVLGFAAAAASLVWFARLP